MTRYYDLILGLIPLALIGITGALSIVGYTLTVAVSLGAVVSVLLIGHALFVNGPVTDTPSAASTPTSSPPINTTD
ncbi:hypothetical protein [Haladaptatus halobius]|uniref:hypothetical protein n=1 Tax=Haladaptatus halobius TaxID=2884875 RepID=UPI001D0A6F08|nr:hypothetical protein [Haladaptatus halobius]